VTANLFIVFDFKTLETQLDLNYNMKL